MAVAINIDKETSSFSSQLEINLSSFNFNCGTNYNIPKSVNGIGCSDWINFAPYISTQTPIKYVRITLHIFQKNDGTGNFQDNTTDRDWLINTLISHLNYKMAHLQPMNLNTSSPYIEDSRIRYVVDQIYFHQDDYGQQVQFSYSWGSTLYNTYVVNNPNITNKYNSIHVFLGEKDGNFYDGYGQASGIADNKWLYITDTYQHYINNVGNWIPSNTLAHELGHLLGLLHTWNGNDNCDDTPNNSNEWNSPTGSNNLMDYNACACALTACQLGRMHYCLMGYEGTVSNVLINDYCNNIETMDINGDYTWDNPIYLKGDLLIEDGSTLIIRCKVSIPQDAKVLVKQGGKLIIDGGTITNVCGDLWKGITVEGDWGIIAGGQSYDPGPGQLVMKNGAKIEYAETGVFSDYNGILDISNSEFLNCPTGISLENYDETVLSWSIFPNLKPRAKIKTTTFSTDEDFISTPLYGVKLWSTDMAMVTLEGDVFENTTTEAQLSAMNRGYGIYAYNSDVNIKEYCPFISLPPCPNPVKSEFNGLTYGIYSQGSLSNTARIENCIFNNYYFRGVLLDHITAPIIRSNNFSNNLTYWTAGLYLWNSTAYNVENNTFNCQNTNNVVINNSGAGANKLYRNHFNTASAVHCYYTNSNPAGDQGLFIQCNDFHATDMNIFVKDGNIKKQQGYYDNQFPNQSVSAANQFEQTYLNDENAFKCDATGYSYFDYTYWFNMSGDVTDITGYTSPNVHPQPIGVTFFDPSAACPSGIPYIGPVDAIAALTAADDQIGLMTSNLNDIVDGGNTSATLNKVTSLAPNNFNRTCNELLDMSPYLSDTVLTTFMQTGVNGHVVAKTNVLYANSPLPPHAKAALDNMILPPPFKNFLLQYQTGTNAVVQKQEEIGAVRFGRNLTLNGVIRYGLQNDSVPGAKDSLITILENETDYTAKYTLIPLLINMKRYDDADGQIADLQSLAATLPTREQQYAMDYADLQTIALQLDSIHATDSVSMAPVVAPNEPLLSLVANDPNHPASGIAQSILKQAGYETFVSPLYQPENNKSLQVSPQENNQHPTIDIDNCVEVYPNPATNELWVEYLMVNGNNLQSIDIYTIKGKKVLSKPVKTAYGMVELDVSSLQSGNYIVKVGNYSKQIAILK